LQSPITWSDVAVPAGAKVYEQWPATQAVAVVHPGSGWAKQIRGGLAGVDLQQRDGERTAQSGRVKECGAFKARGAGGADWYRYEGSTTSILGASPYENDPSGLVSSSVNVQFCICMSCTTADFMCRTGTMAATSPSGHPGCCLSGTNPGMDIRHVCSDADVWMSVQSTDATTCAAYDFTFHY
jgi:hypothetical protein